MLADVVAPFIPVPSTFGTLGNGPHHPVRPRSAEFTRRSTPAGCPDVLRCFTGAISNDDNDADPWSTRRFFAARFRAATTLVRARIDVAERREPGVTDQYGPGAPKVAAFFSIASRVSNQNQLHLEFDYLNLCNTRQLSSTVKFYRYSQVRRVPGITGSLPLKK